MKKRGESGIAAVLILGLMCAAFSGCGGGGGGSQVGGSIQGTALSLDNSVSTFAGALTSGSSDGVGTGARFFTPIGITTDGANFYLADSFNHTIRKVVVATGEATTLAGSAGSPGFVNAPVGPGTVARFDTPQGITTDGTNLYVADTNNHAIRKVVIATGVVTTLAGTGLAGSGDGNGATAEFILPGGITMDGTHLFVADSGNSTIRRVVTLTGFVDTIAGSASSPPGFVNAASGLSARFNLPQGIMTDGTSLFVADSFNHTIRKVNKTSPWGVSTLAGSGSPGFLDGLGTSAEFFSPYGMTSDGTYLYVADSGNNTIRRVTIATGNVSTVAGDVLAGPGFQNGVGANALFNTPDGITTDGIDLYVTDSGNNMIRRIQ